MKTSSTAGWVVAAIVVIAIIGWAITRATNSLPTLGGVENASSTNSTTSDTSSSGSTGTKTGSGSPSNNLGLVYGNATYGFTISYPSGLRTQPFDNFHALNQNDWHYGASMTFRGTPVISIPVIEIDNQAANKKLSPLYYTAQVRIGVSPDTANCYSLNTGYSSQKISNVTIGGVAFKKFDFGDSATGQYVRGSDYRTIHNKKCYIIEQVENGSTYTDSTLAVQYSDATLKSFYNQTTSIINTFRFKQ